MFRQRGLGNEYPTTNGGVGIQAEKRPGEFTIPKGTKGAKLKYNFSNPKSGTTLTKLTGWNVYSVTEKRYMHELDKNPDFELSWSQSAEFKRGLGWVGGPMRSFGFTVVIVLWDRPTLAPGRRGINIPSSSSRRMRRS